jgi:hypothetical protein
MRGSESVLVSGAEVGVELIELHSVDLIECVEWSGALTTMKREHDLFCVLGSIATGTPMGSVLYESHVFTGLHARDPRGLQLGGVYGSR